MYNFGEKKEEYHAKIGKNIPVWQSDKYIQSKKKAIELIDSKKYDLCEADFWILMNATKSGKMAYTGLIISHNACLKINDKLDNKFAPECVTVNQSGYNDSLVFTYNAPEQGIYEVGEVSTKNCKNDYPYAMALKRCYDRVVLKLSKIAFYGIYSEAENDEFKHQEEPTNADIDLLLGFEDCQTVEDVEKYWKQYHLQAKDKEAFKNKGAEMKAKLLGANNG